MSDISLNLDGLIAFLAAAALGLSLLLVIFVGSLFTVLKSRQKHQRFSSQRFFRHLIGMAVSLICCVAVELLLLLSDSTLPPRTISIWLDRWVILWLAVVLALWPLSVFVWKRLRPVTAIRSVA
jgi:hypothetical protein